MSNDEYSAQSKTRIEDKDMEAVSDTLNGAKKMDNDVWIGMQYDDDDTGNTLRKLKYISAPPVYSCISIKTSDVFAVPM